MAEVAEATGFVSQYTGEKIEQAIAAYWNGDTRTTVVINITATPAIWRTNSSMTFSAKYYADIATSGSLNVGNYPDIFIINNNGEKIIPDVDYSAKNGTFKIYSNTMIAGVVVIIGSKQIQEQTTEQPTV